MSAINPRDIAKYAGVVSVATRPASVTAANSSNSNVKAVISEIESAVTFTRLASITNLQVNTNTADSLVEQFADEPDTQEIYSAGVPLHTINFDVFEIKNFDALGILYGKTVNNTAGSLVSGATQVKASGSWGYNDPFVIENQNGDGTQLTINSVTGGTDGALVANTDYFVGQNAAGDTVVTVIDSATVTTESQTITVDYDYTPNASQETAIRSVTTELPRLIIKIVAEDENGNQLKAYLENCRIDGDVTLPFLDPTNNGSLVPGSLSFVSRRGGQLLLDDAIL